MEPAYAGSIGGLAVMGAVILCGVVYFAYECRHAHIIRRSREESFLSSSTPDHPSPT